MFPRWVAWFNVAIGVALVPAGFAGLSLSGVFAWDGFVSFWVKNVAIALVDRGDGRGARPGDGARSRRGRGGQRDDRRGACARDPKRELWFAWYSTVAFYSLYSVVFFVLTRTQPPGQPWLEPEQTVDWFADRHWGLLIGFALIFVLGGFSATSIALITYSIRRMSVSPRVRVLVPHPLRGRRHPRVPVHLRRHDRRRHATRPQPGARSSGSTTSASSRSSGTMGVFLVGSLIWMAAILLDENGVFPRWFGYLNLCNALTEVVIAPSWIFQRGVLA